MRRALHTFLLVFAFLFAQAGMVAHAASHVDAVQHDDGGLGAEAVCDLCAGYAQLSGAAPLPKGPSLVASDGGCGVVSVDAAGVPGRVFFFALARAPPVFS